MAEEEQQSAKRMKFENDENDETHIGEDYSSPNIKLIVSIAAKLYLDEQTADIHFLFETNDNDNDNVERLPAHKLILSTGSKVFHTMFHGSMPEGDVVKIANGSASSFKEFLQFFYLDVVNLTTGNIADVMNYVRQYGIERCMVQCVDFLKDTMTNEDVCSVYQLAVQFELDDLKHFCQRKISANAEDVLKSNDFLNCDRTLLQLIVNMDSLMCEETNVLNACVAWAKTACKINALLDPCDGAILREQLGESVLHSIHFNRMKIEDFATRNAKLNGLFTIAELSDILQLIVCKEFKSSSFTSNPVTYELFTRDEKRIIECSFDGLIEGKNLRHNLQTESINLSCKVPLLLHKIKFATYNPANVLEPEKAIKLDLFQKIDDKEKLLLTQNFSISSGDVMWLELSKPILIHPKRSYKIQLHYSEPTSTIFGRSNGILSSQLMKYGNIKIGDLELNLMQGEKSCGGFIMLRAMYFNRI